MDLQDQLKNLLVMAVADGSLTEAEINFLRERIDRWGISDPQFVDAIDYALSDGAHLTIPPTYDLRAEMLRDLIRMMAADGQLAEIEKQLFAAAAARMEISDEQLNEIIDSIV